MNISTALSGIPPGLRDPLLEEYRSIIQNYLEHRWTPSELSGGKFCEIVFTVLQGFPTDNYAAAPIKPPSFVNACKQLENVTGIPRSFQILIPRFLPALYEIRNNRGVGHVGGDVDPNFMDASAVVALAKWIMAELLRVFHNLPVDQAQKAADALSERTIPLIWESEDVKLILDPTIKLREQILIFLSVKPEKVALADIVKWTETKNKDHFRRTLKELHKQRLLFISADNGTAQILPPGTKRIEDMLRERSI